MRTLLRLREADGLRDLTAAQLPFAVGLSEHGELLFGSDAATKPWAWIGQADGALFVQGVPGIESIEFNQQALRESCWLAAGDELKLEQAVIEISIEQDVLVLGARLSSRDPVLTPPASIRPAAQTKSAVESASVAGASPATTPEPVSKPGPAAAHAVPATRQATQDVAVEAVTAAEIDPLLPPAPLPGRTGRRRRVFALLLLGVLTLGVLLTLLARPLEIVVEPVADSLSLTGLIPPFRYTERYLALPGAYRLRATKEGYRELDTRFSIEFGERPVLSYKLEKLPGRLSITARPVTDVEVLVDARPAGRTPLDNLEIKAGKHTVKLIAERYLPLQLAVDIEGMGRAQRLDAQLIPGWGQVHVQSEPTGAAVILDGDPAGVTPTVLEPMAGSYRLELRLPGWTDVSHQLEIEANSETGLPPFVLRKAPGKLSLSSSPAGATVLVNGSARGTTPLTLALAADTDHNIVLGKPGYVRASRRMRVTAGKSTSLKLTLKPQYGVVFITSRPADATLSIDGKPAASASRRLRLRTVPHRLEVSKPGYETYSRVVTPSTKLSKKLDVQLKRIDKRPANTGSGSRLTPSGSNLLEFVPAQPAQFVMGASRREQGRRSNETLHTVTLTRSFLIADKEVSNAQYRRFNARHDSGRAFGFDLNGDEQPVVNVSWDDAARYLNWLSQSQGLTPAYREDDGRVTPVQPMNEGYRLPTEAEWAWVARYEGGRRSAEKPLKYPWQGAWPPPKGAGNFADSAIADHLQVTVAGYSDGQSVAAQTGSGAANAAGLYDLGGNVSEWCHDYYDVYTGGEDTVTRDPTGAPSGQNHSIRGASWRHGSITELRLSFRDYGRAGRNDLGIRVARYVQAPTR